MRRRLAEHSFLAYRARMNIAAEHHSRRRAALHVKPKADRELLAKRLPMSTLNRFECSC